MSKILYRSFLSSGSFSEGDRFRRLSFSDGESPSGTLRRRAQLRLMCLNSVSRLKGFTGGNQKQAGKFEGNDEGQNVGPTAMNDHQRNVLTLTRQYDGDREMQRASPSSLRTRRFGGGVKEGMMGESERAVIGEGCNGGQRQNAATERTLSVAVALAATGEKAGQRANKLGRLLQLCCADWSAGGSSESGCWGKMSGTDMGARAQIFGERKRWLRRYWRRLIGCVTFSGERQKS